MSWHSLPVFYFHLVSLDQFQLVRDMEAYKCTCSEVSLALRGQLDMYQPFYFFVVGTSCQKRSLLLEEDYAVPTGFLWEQRILRSTLRHLFDCVSLKSTVSRSNKL